MIFLKSNITHRGVLFLFILVCCGNCSQEIDKGNISNNIYSNKYFGLKIEIPMGWKASQNDEIMNESSVDNDIFINANPWIPELIKSNRDSLHVLLTLSKDMTDGKLGPYIMCIAEKIDRRLPNDQSTISGKV